jgi:hypothetical protein
MILRLTITDWQSSIGADLLPFFEQNGLLPSVPIHENRSINLIANPFLPDVQDGEGVIIMHPACSHKRIQIVVPASGHVDGLIKVRVWKGQREGSQASSLVERVPLRNQLPLSQVAENIRASQELSEESSSSSYPRQPVPPRAIACLPESFGRPKLDATDKKIFDFCKYF